jgi:hypothetical protein
MTHLPYVVAAYVLGVVMPLSLAVSAFLRMRSARRRLVAIDPRVNRPWAGPRRAR